MFLMNYNGKYFKNVQSSEKKSRSYRKWNKTTKKRSKVDHISQAFIFPAYFCGYCVLEKIIKKRDWNRGEEKRNGPVSA